MPGHRRREGTESRRGGLAVRRVGRLVVEVGRKYSEDRGPLIAAAVSFFALLSLIPLVLLGVWGLGQFLSSAEAFHHVIDYLEDYLPGSSDIAEPYIAALVKSHRTFGWLGIVGLIWSGSQAFVILELAINLTLRLPERRSFLESRLLGIAMIFFAGGLLVLSLVITSTVSTIQNYNYSLPWGHWSPGQIPLVWSVIGAVVPVLLTILSFSVVYRIAPNTRVPWRSALIAGTAAGLLWEAAKHAFTDYLPSLLSRGYQQLYGSIAGLIAVVFWIYYSSVILVLGAELVSVLQDIHPKAPSPNAKRRAPQPRVQAGGKRRR
jgi:membrane protein